MDYAFEYGYLKARVEMALSIIENEYLDDETKLLVVKDYLESEDKRNDI